MRFVYVLIALCVAKVNSQGLFGSLGGGLANTVGKVVDGRGNNKGSGCSRDVTNDYMKSQHEFHTRFYNTVGAQSVNHFVYSPYPIWLTLSALTEGSDPAIRSQLFAKLLLPQEACLRKSFYDIAIRIEQPANDVTITNRRLLFLDDGAQLNPDWLGLVKTAGLIGVDFVPIHNDPVAMEQVYQTHFAGSQFSTDGNSIILNAFEYQGLWTTEFSSTSEEPFYNDQRQQVGTVKMMRLKTRVRLAHLPLLTAKVLELPVGTNGRYTMLLMVNMGEGFLKNALGIFISSIVKIFSLLQMSLVPIDIAIPQIAVSSQYDARPYLETMGFGAYITNPQATSYVSSPPALPSTFIQRVTIRMGPDGLTKAPVHSGDGLFGGVFGVASNTATGLAAAVGRDFIANKPFMYALFDTKTNTCIFAGAYSQPNA